MNFLPWRKKSNKDALEPAVGMPGIKSTPLSIHPDPNYFVEADTNPFARVCRVIDVSDGGVLGITGERGAGKSVLLNKLSDKYSKSQNHFTVNLSSPISMSKEMEFFTMLFRHLVQRVVTELRDRQQSRKNDIYQMGTAAISSERRFYVFALLALLSTAGAAWVAGEGYKARQDRIRELSYLIRYSSDHTPSSSASNYENGNNRILALNTELATIEATWLPFSYSRYSSYLVLIPGLASLLAAILLVKHMGGISRLLGGVMKPAVLERGLLLYSEQTALRLDYELTRTADRSIEIAPKAWIKGVAKLSRQEKARAISLPELTANYIEFISNVLKVFPGKVIVCIDELDKISDIEQIKFILREIKGALYIKNTFYILSISNDALRSFEGRMGDQRDIFESTFDDVFPVRALEFSTCIEILKSRIEGGVEIEARRMENDPTLGIISVFSAGNARDLVRAFRECVLNGKPGVLPEPLEAWEILFTRRLEAISDRIMAIDAPPDLKGLFYPSFKGCFARPIVDAAIFCEIRKRLDTYTLFEKSNLETILIAKRLLKYAAEIEILLRLREVVLTAKHENLTTSALYLMKAYQVLPFSLQECVAVLDGGRDSEPLLTEAKTSIVVSPLNVPVADRGDVLINH